ncbi:hypothetical protein NE237_009496 [Protea cynaroides]|uniref:Rab-GAP TBC domain-containing protein n=1 Tax=Protea cynaroides TaxID=273540 RepID=A0A9Q0KXY5_9MAGN|nr:hypothetical protein NE237_009496 [Protea cynaroides]
MKGTFTKNFNPLITFEHKRDTYGFAVRPQHLQRYREYSNIYKVEEEERSDRWEDFLERQAESAQSPVNGISEEEGNAASHTEAKIQEADTVVEKTLQEGDTIVDKTLQEADTIVENVEEASSGSKSAAEDPVENVPEQEEASAEKDTKMHKVQIWTHIRPSLISIEDMMSFRVKKRKNLLNEEQGVGRKNNLSVIEEERPSKGAPEEDSEDEFYDMERSDPVQDTSSLDNVNSSSGGDAVSPEPFFPWKVELESLVRGGVPMALRGELWQAFVGVKARRLDGYYHGLLATEVNAQSDKDFVSASNGTSKGSNTGGRCANEKWKGQIEKDLPRTFPGHPALDEDGRNALRRLLTAYARHNPSVGYCQAMNFFAGLLLLLMPEENAFWTLVGIIDDYFDGYYSEEMIESQVDQLVLEDLVRERFPKLVNHLDYLGVQVAWVTGPWFLSIFVNMLPWESVLRVWDVLLFEGNRVMLFRTALALLELYGPALVTTKDAGDAVTLLQSLSGSTFDSSQLVLTASMGYQTVNEARLQELREKHRSSVIAAMEERSKGPCVRKDSLGLASKLYSFKNDHGPLTKEANAAEGLGDLQTNGDLCPLELIGDTDADSLPDLQEQVVWLKVELCRLLEEKRSAVLRAEELETALMEMVKQDNRRQLSAKVEQLEQEVAELRQALTDKQEQERVMLQVLMRVEQEQKLTEDARRFAEQDAAAQRYAANILQEKYEGAMASLAQMEKRAVMAETMLEATLQYQSGQVKAVQSPRAVHRDSSTVQPTQEPAQDIPTRKISLLSRPFGLGWRDRNKEPIEGNINESGQSTVTLQKDTNGQQ